MQKKMTPDERFQHWLEYAKRDLDAAEAMFSSGRWFYAVFMSQQAIEKEEAAYIFENSKELFVWLTSLKK